MVFYVQLFSFIQYLLTLLSIRMTPTAKEIRVIPGEGKTGAPLGNASLSQGLPLTWQYGLLGEFSTVKSLPPGFELQVNLSETNMVQIKYKHSSYGETKRLVGEGEFHPEPILFREKLYVFDENGNRIGRFSLNIDDNDSNSDSQKILYVHISNRASVDGRLSESIVTGTVTPRLKTLEEIRYECTDVADSGQHKRHMFLLRERTKYYVSVTTKVSDVENREHSTIPFVEALGLTGECANAILLRKLALKGYEGILCMKTILSNGKRCKNYYVTKLCEQSVNGVKMQVLVVFRNITNHRKYNFTMTMALTRAGQLIYLFWSNSKCFLHVDPNAVINPKRSSYAESKLQDQWQKDIQLHSIYLDRVDHQLVLNRSYKYQSDELRRILADFIQFLLLTKPEDVVCFAIQYFSSFGHGCMRKCPSGTKYSDTSFERFQNFGESEGDNENFNEWMGEAEFFYGL